jgi:hypothetical protein
MTHTSHGMRDQITFTRGNATRPVPTFAQARVSAIHVCAPGSSRPDESRREVIAHLLQWRGSAEGKINDHDREAHRNGESRRLRRET